MLLVAAVLLGGAGAGAWLAYFRWKDKQRPEPLVVLIIALIAGVPAVLGASLGYDALELAGFTAGWFELAGPWPDAGRSALLIGVLEEIAKLAPVWIIARFSRHFDEPLDGFVYAAAASTGFALAETLALASRGDLTLLEIAARAAAAPITHALFAAPWGLGIARQVLDGRRWTLPVGFLASALLHAAYDLSLARPRLRTLAPALIAGTWAWMLWMTLRLQREPRVEREG